MPRVFSQEAHKEARIKRTFELKLHTRLRDEFMDEVRLFARSYSVLRQIPILEIPRSNIESILFDHYVMVANRFGFRMRTQMPKELAMTGAEESTFERIILETFAVRAVKQSRFITDTTFKMMDRAITVAIEARGELEDIGDMSRFNVAAEAAQWLVRRNASRLRAISCYETQWSAETSKFIEVSVLVGDTGVEVKAKRKVKRVAVKQWDSVGDHRVRNDEFDHLAADGIQVPVDQPYKVSGESLMFPGDTTLGASSGNVINCRCSSKTDISSVITSRQDLDAFIEVEDIVLPRGRGDSIRRIGNAPESIKISFEGGGITDRQHNFAQGTFDSLNDDMQRGLTSGPDKIKVRMGRISDMSPRTGTPAPGVRWDDLPVHYDSVEKTIFLGPTLEVTVEHQALMYRAMGSAIDDVWKLTTEPGFLEAIKDSMQILNKFPRSAKSVIRFTEADIATSHPDILQEAFAIIHESSSLGKAKSAGFRQIFKPVNEWVNEFYGGGKKLRAASKPLADFPTIGAGPGGPAVVVKPSTPKRRPGRRKKTDTQKAIDATDQSQFSSRIAERAAFDEIKLKQGGVLTPKQRAEKMFVNTGKASPEYEHTIKNQFEKLPKKVTELLEAKEVDIRFGHHLKQANERLLAYGEEYDRIEGVFIWRWVPGSGGLQPKGMDVTLAEFKRWDKARPWTRTKRARGTITHELGHSFDVTTAGKMKDDFTAAWEKSKVKISKELELGVQAELKYYTDDVREAFAESFALTHTADGSSAHTAPVFRKFFKEAMDELDKITKRVESLPSSAFEGKEVLILD